MHAQKTLIINIIMVILKIKGTTCCLNNVYTVVQLVRAVIPQLGSYINTSYWYCAQCMHVCNATTAHLAIEDHSEVLQPSLPVWTKKLNWNEATLKHTHRGGHIQTQRIYMDKHNKISHIFKILIAAVHL